MSSSKPQLIRATSAFKQRARALVPGVGLLLLFALSIAWLAHAAQQPEPTTGKAQQTAAGPIIPPAKGDQCVADTALMRTDHMDLLNHQRDETVIRGIRNQPFSLVECVNCHAQTASDGTPVRIDAEGQFCQSCHQYAAVKIDCFTCHAAVPEQASDKNKEQSAMHTLDAVTGSVASNNQPHSMLTVDQTKYETSVNPIQITEQFGKDNEHAANN